MSTNGSTAIDFSEAASTGGEPAGFEFVTGVAGAGAARRADSQNLSAANPAMASSATPASAMVARFTGVRLALRAVPRPSGAAIDAWPLAGPAMTRRTAVNSFGSALASPSLLTSSHCEVLRKYSRAAGSGTWSMRSVSTGCRFEAARSTSRSTCGDATALFDSTMMIALEASIARTIASA